jgi:glycerophosphoryl diester phosphodiesterase
VLKIGHRGAPHRATENTIDSFRAAIALGADGIELDVHRCKSGELVVFHDVGMDRLTTGQGMVRDLTLAQMRDFPMHGGGTIPVLEDVLEALGKEIYYFIELKPADAVLPAVKLIENYGACGWKHLILISFQHEALKLAPSVAIGATFENLAEGDMEKAKAMGSHMVLPSHAGLTKTQVESAHKMGLQVVSWTVNEPADIARMKAIGVDGIISDYPDRLG